MRLYFQMHLFILFILNLFLLPSFFERIANLIFYVVKDI
jgi:hypothetical protein